MPADVKISRAVASQMADAAIGNRADDGTVEIYAGHVPVSADEPIADQILLVSLRMARDAFLPAVEGRVVANAIGDAIAVESGAASFFRVVSAAGLVLYQGTCGTLDADMLLNSVAVTQGGRFALTELEYQVDAG